MSYVRHYSPRTCPHCMGCSDVIDDCDTCDGTGSVLCEECGNATGFAATVHCDRGELCGACYVLYEQDAA